ncbi:MAG TPA: 3-isopropylmalate dehydratase large subunit, partial [Euryarchaeota archaeon]|nr:3-isopropylmalate dehydratase large subunit [Euryarchaeota archaeon]
TEKILCKNCGKESVENGEIIIAKVDRAMSHDNAALVSKHFKGIGVDKVWNSDHIVIILDHRAPANNIKTAEGHRTIRNFVRQQNISNFYDIKAGICHQVMPELGHVAPGMLIAGTDSHTTTYGALGAFSTGIGATEMAGVWATGELWLKVPEVFKINVNGTLPPGVYPKDVILKIIGHMGADGANYAGVEYFGNTIDAMSVGERMTMSNMSMEMGAKSAIIPPDEKVRDYLSQRFTKNYQNVHPDTDAVYRKELHFDVSDLEPQIACPHSVDNVRPIAEILGTPIDQAVLGSCTNGRLEDLEVAAKILDQKRVHDRVRLIVAPASQEVLLDAIRAGHIETFIKAGGVVINSGCGPCLGAHQGILAEGERAIATTNRNFKGRMGSPDSEVYLASPAVVACSAIKGEIADPREVA